MLRRCRRVRSILRWPCPYTPATNPAAIAVNRNQIQVKSVEGDLWGQAEVTVRFKAAGIGNNFGAGVEGGQEISDPIRSSYTINKINTVPSTNLVTPNPAARLVGRGISLRLCIRSRIALGCSSWIRFTWGSSSSLSGGVRWDWFDTNFNSVLASPASGWDGDG